MGGGGEERAEDKQVTGWTDPSAQAGYQKASFLLTLDDLFDSLVCLGTFASPAVSPTPTTAHPHQDTL